MPSHGLIALLLSVCKTSISPPPSNSFIDRPFQGGGSDVVSVACVGVRISMMFHLMFVHNTFSSVWVVGHLLVNSCPLGLQSVLIVLFLYVI